MRLIFMGTAPFACPTLRPLLASPHQIVAVVTQPDRPRGRGQQAAASAVKVLALEHHLTILQPASLRPAAVVRGTGSVAARRYCGRSVWQPAPASGARAAAVWLYQSPCLFAPQIPRGGPGALGPHPWRNGDGLHDHADGRASRHRAHALA